MMAYERTSLPVGTPGRPLMRITGRFARHEEAPRAGAPHKKGQDVKAWSEYAPRTWGLALMAVASFVVVLPTWVVATVLSTIRRELSDSIAAPQTVQGHGLLGAELRLLPWTATLCVTSYRFTKLYKCDELQQ